MEDALSILRKRREAEFAVMGDIQVTCTSDIVNNVKTNKLQKENEKGKKRYRKNIEKCREQHRRYNRTHPEVMHKANQKYYRTHREKELARRKKWREDNPEMVKKESRDQYYKHREDHIARITQWKADNPEKVKEYDRKSHRRRWDKIKADPVKHEAYSAKRRQKYLESLPEDKRIKLEKKREKRTMKAA